MLDGSRTVGSCRAIESDNGIEAMRGQRIASQGRRDKSSRCVFEFWVEVVEVEANTDDA